MNKTPYQGLIESEIIKRKKTQDELYNELKEIYKDMLQDWLYPLQDFSWRGIFYAFNLFMFCTLFFGSDLLVILL